MKQRVDFITLKNTSQYSSGMRVYVNYKRIKGIKCIGEIEGYEVTFKKGLFYSIFTIYADEKDIELKNSTFQIGIKKKNCMSENGWRIEKQWKYKDYECLITYASNSCIEDYRCGYVVLGDDDYVNTENISCHGGVTCYGWHDRLEKSVVGFDCAHYGDSLEKCTLDYCIQQCESIVDQLLTLNNGEDKNDT